MRKFKVLFVLSVIFVLNCTSQNDRRIKLADRPINGMVREKVSVIQVAASQKKCIAPLYIANRTGDKDLDWLENGIIEMLSSDISQSRELCMIPYLKVKDVLKKHNMSDYNFDDMDANARIVNYMNADAYLLGSYFYRRDSLVIDAALHLTKDGSQISRTSASGYGLEQVFTMVDKISRILKNDMQEVFRDIQNVAPTEYPTKSVAAYKYYIQGVEATEKIYAPDAVPLFKKAIELDSTFALPYFRLISVFDVLGRAEDSRWALQQAVKYAENAPFRDRMEIYARQAANQSNFHRTIEIYKKLASIFPEDEDIHYSLGNYYYFLGRYRDAIEEYEAARALNPDQKLLYNMLGYSYARINKLDPAIETLKKYADMAPEEANPHDSMGEIYYMAGYFDKAISEYKMAIKKDKSFRPTWRNMINCYLDIGDIERAEKIAKSLYKNSESKEEQREFHVMLAQVYLAKNEIDRARDMVLKSAEVSGGNARILNMLFYLDPYLDDAKRMFFSVLDSASREIQDRSDLGVIGMLSGLSLSHQIGIEKVDSLINAYLNTFPEMYGNERAYAMKQIMAVYLDQPIETIMNLVTQFTTKEIMLTIPKIGWDGYWRFYNLALIHSGLDRDKLREMVEIQRKHAEKNGNMGFEIGWTASLALCDALQGMVDEAAAERRYIGMPEEKAWFVNGPYAVTEGFHQSFSPESQRVSQFAHTILQNPSWRTAFDGMPEGYLDLREALNADYNYAGYALLAINSPSARDVQLRIGANRPIKVWFNDKLVLVKNVYTEAVIDGDIIWAKLSKGTNWLLVKTVSRLGQSGIYLRITDENGYGIKDITFGLQDAIS